MAEVISIVPGVTGTSIDPALQSIARGAGSPEEASRLLQERGYEQSTVDAILRNAGVVSKEEEAPRFAERGIAPGTYTVEQITPELSFKARMMIGRIQAGTEQAYLANLPAPVSPTAGHIIPVKANPIAGKPYMWTKESDWNKLSSSQQEEVKASSQYDKETGKWTGGQYTVPQTEQQARATSISLGVTSGAARLREDTARLREASIPAAVTKAGVVYNRPLLDIAPVPPATGLVGWWRGKTPWMEERGETFGGRLARTVLNPEEKRFQYEMGYAQQYTGGGTWGLPVAVAKAPIGALASIGTFWNRPISPSKKILEAAEQYVPPVATVTQWPGMSFSERASSFAGSALWLAMLGTGGYYGVKGALAKSPIPEPIRLGGLGEYTVAGETPTHVVYWAGKRQGWVGGPIFPETVPLSWLPRVRVSPLFTEAQFRPAIAAPGTGIFKLAPTRGLPGPYQGVFGTYIRHGVTLSEKELAGQAFARGVVPSPSNLAWLEARRAALAAKGGVASTPGAQAIRLGGSGSNWRTGGGMMTGWPSLRVSPFQSLREGMMDIRFQRPTSFATYATLGGGAVSAIVAPIGVPMAIPTTLAEAIVRPSAITVIARESIVAPIAARGSIVTSVATRGAVVTPLAIGGGTTRVSLPVVEKDISILTGMVKQAQITPEQGRVIIQQLVNLRTQQVTQSQYQQEKQVAVEQTLTPVQQQVLQQKIQEQTLQQQTPVQQVVQQSAIYQQQQQQQQQQEVTQQQEQPQQQEKQPGRGGGRGGGFIPPFKFKSPFGIGGLSGGGGGFGGGFGGRESVGEWEFGRASLYLPGVEGSVLPARRHGAVQPRVSRQKKKIGITESRLDGSTINRSGRTFKPTVIF